MRIVLVFLVLMVVSIVGVGALLSSAQHGNLTAVAAGPGATGGSRAANASGSSGNAPTGAQANANPAPAAAQPAAAQTTGASAAPVADGQTVTFTVHNGETTGTIAQRLVEMGLVRNALIFRLRVQWSGAEGKLQAGDYQLHQGMAEDEIIDALQTAKAKDVAITFVEGRRIEEYADQIEKANVGIDAKRFLDLAQHGNFAYDFLESKPAGASLEGFLFPDTYRVIPGKTTPEELIHMMLKRFGETVTPQMRDTAMKNSGLNVYQLVTMASIVEREAQVKEERPRIAAAYENRLHDKEGLFADPTVQYVLGQPGNWWPTLTDTPRNIKPDSPYNTYTHGGLPPSPICNPGAASLKAAADPEKTDVKYFVRNDIKNDGSHVFARTLAEHEANIAKYSRQ